MGAGGRDLPPGWLRRQSLYCLSSPYGAIDVFRSVAGLDSWRACASRSLRERTAGGVVYQGIGDEDTLKSQLALKRSERKPGRVFALRRSLKGKRHAQTELKKT